MKITITQGAYGWRPYGDGRVKTVRAGQSCEVSKAEAKRLVKMGVAEYTPTETIATPAMPPADNTGGNDTPGEGNGSVTLTAVNGVAVPDTLGIVDGHFVIEDLEQMTNANLSKLATDLGLDIKDCKVKDDFVALLASVELDMIQPASGDKDEGNDTVNDNEAPPDLGAEPPVL